MWIPFTQEFIVPIKVEMGSGGDNIGKVYDNTNDNNDRQRTNFDRLKWATYS